MPLTVARPLLDYTRREILEACARLGLDFVTDSTNNDTAYTRNRLRHTVVPALEALAGAGVPQRAAARLSRAAREDDVCLSSLAEEQVAAHTAPDGGLELAALQSSHPAIAKRMIGILYDRATAGACPHGQGTLAAVHLDGLWELIQKGIPESSLNLPLSMTARIRGGRLYVGPTAPTPPPTEPIPVSLGDTPWGDRVLVRIEASESILPPLAGQDVWASAVFPPTLPMPLTARPRAQGDTIHSHGMNKKLKKLLCDKNIPPHLRDTLPLLCLPDGTPLWYPAAAFRDGFPAPREGACLRITVFLQNQI
jgi:tRNA(Ile)-lysidine synthase